MLLKTKDETAKRADLLKISNALTRARRGGLSIDAYPGEIPSDLTEAYAIQRRSIDSWPDSVAGWKVGGIPLDFREKYRADRLAGPIFKNAVKTATNSSQITMSVFAGGFAAFEAEWVFELDDTSRYPHGPASEAETLSFIRAGYMGLEIASSPLKTINDLGPAVVVSDFGNNAGLVLGHRLRAEDMTNALAREVKVSINGVEAGKCFSTADNAAAIGAVDFLIRHLRDLGINLPAGGYVSTGALTGIHEAFPGDHGMICFQGIGEIDVKLVPFEKSLTA